MRAHLVEAHAGEHARPVGVGEGLPQRMQRRHVAGAPEAQHAQLPHLQKSSGTSLELGNIS